MARNRYLVFAPFLLLPVLLSGCSNDSWQRAGTWRPTGANALNLHAMIADPHDLKQGQAATGSSGAMAARPVTALLAGKEPSGGQSQSSSVSTGMTTSIGAGY